jgi:hypothetical protein
LGEGGLVDGEALLLGGRRDVFFGGVAFLVEVFGIVGGEDFEVGQAELGGCKVRDGCFAWRFGCGGG